MRPLLFRLAPQIFRRLVQLSVVAFMIYAAAGGPWRNFKRAHNSRRLVALMEGDTWGKIYGWNDDLLGFFGSSYDASLNVLGMPWAATVFGLNTVDPIMVLGHAISTRTFSLPLLTGLLVPLGLAALLGKVFCSHLCPARLVFDLSQAVRRGLLRLGVDLPTFRMKTRLGGWVLLGGLLATLVAGMGVWTLILPYVAAGMALFFAISAGTTTGLVAVIGGWALVDLFAAPGFFCHNLCPQGFVLETFGRFSLLQLVKKADTCPSTCRTCEKVCPYGLSPREQTHQPACDNCGICAAACPQGILSRRVAKPQQARRQLPVVGLLALGMLSISSSALAHHNKGMPHYGYFENYPQVPTEEYVTLQKGFEFGGTIFNFQGYERIDSDTPNDVKFFLYVYDLKKDKAYLGPADFQILLDDKVITSFSREKVDEEMIYSTRETLPESGDYVMAVTLKSEKGTRLELPFSVDLASDRVNWALILGLFFPVLLVFVLALHGRSRRAKKPRQARASPGAASASLLFVSATLALALGVAQPALALQDDPPAKGMACGSGACGKGSGAGAGLMQHGADGDGAESADDSKKIPEKSAPAKDSAGPRQVFEARSAGVADSAMHSKSAAPEKASAGPERSGSAGGKGSGQAPERLGADGTPAVPMAGPASANQQRFNDAEAPAEPKKAMACGAGACGSGAGNHGDGTDTSMTHYTTQDGGQVMVMGGIPRWLFLLGVAGILLFSFLVVEIVGVTRKRGFRINLIANKKIYRIVRHRAFQAIPQLTMTLLLFGILYAGLFGSRVQNIAPVAVWTVWWAGLIIVIALLGPVFCFACPWDGLSNLASRLRAWAKVEPLTFGFRFPQWLQNVYPALFLFVILTWLELGFGVTTDPRGTAYMGLAMSSMAVLFVLLYDGKKFCAHFCPVGRISGIYSNFAPVEIRGKNPSVCANCKTEDCLYGADDGYPCPTGISLKVINEATHCTFCTECIKSCKKQNIAFNLRPFGSDLAVEREGRMDEAWLALALLALTLFHGLSMTPVWENFAPGGMSLLKWMSVNLGTPRVLNFTLAMVVANALPILLYWISCNVAAWWTGFIITPKTLFVQFAYSLLPVALFYHLAHNLMHLLMEGGALIPLLSDPLGTGANYFGTADLHVGHLISEQAIWIAQVALILLGHVIGIVVAHRIGHRLYSDRKLAAKSVLPMFVVMVIISIGGLGLMALDMNMRVGRM
jgi:polyferredoxin